MTIDELLRITVEAGGSDLHLQAGGPPKYRVHGDLKPIPNEPIIDQDFMAKLLEPILIDDLRKRFEEEKAVDFSHRVLGAARFRVAVFMQQEKMGAVFRQIPEIIPSLDKLGAPAALLDFARLPRGLVLVTGPTGSGKSTTLAAVLDVINNERYDHILTIEDPIEFVHNSKRCLVNQREIGRDSPSFPRALRDALRQDPDVILVGEMRDLETVQTAMTAAETGHLVFGTLHTSSAPSTIDRVIDQFPSTQQQQVRVMLASSLVGVVTQTLLPTVDGQGRVAAHEVLVVNNPVKAHIRQQQVEQIRTVLQTSAALGMQTMDRALVHLVVTGKVDESIARQKSQDLKEFDQLLESAKMGKNPAPPRLVSSADIKVEMGQGASKMDENTPAQQNRPNPPQPPQPGQSRASEPPQPSQNPPQPPQSSPPEPRPMGTSMQTPEPPSFR